MAELNHIQTINGVNEGLGVSEYLISVQSPTILRYAVLNGVNKKLVNDSRVPVVGHIRLIKGRLITQGSHEILLTKTFAKNMNLDIGDTIPITHMASKEVKLENFDKYPIKSKSPFTVVGIINDIPNEGIISLDVANELIYNSSDLKFDFINVKTDPKQLDQVKNTIQQSNPNYAIWNEPSNDLSHPLSRTLLIMLFIGSILMLLATFKSVKNRKNEFGMLKAVGWNNKIIMRMLFMETIIQAVIVWIIALITTVTFLTIDSTIGFSFLIIKFSSIVYLLIVTLLLSLIMPIIGILLPVLYVVRLKPTEALKYE
jgi:ABC-type lipoprotein release transport system permease subunit